MPAGLPGSTSVQNAANPSLGNAVLYDLLSGPKGSAKDFDLNVPYLGNPGVQAGMSVSGNASTGALSNGIGFGTPPVFGTAAVPFNPGGTVQGFAHGSFTDDYVAGVSKTDATASANSTYMYIGGGRSNADGSPNPYTAGFGIGMAGQGGSRDGGAGPVFTGFLTKIVTAAAGVAVGGVVETGYVNRAGVALLTGQSVVGSASAASAAVA